MVLLHEVLKFGKQKGAAPTVGLVLIVESNRHEVPRVFVGKGLEDSVVNHAKDGGGCANSEGQCENGDESEVAILCKASKGDAEVSRKNL
jgi:hypothetical protein